MKKKISLLGLILILVFSFSGCGKSDDTVEYDQEQLEQYADFIVQNFSMMGEADFQNFSDMSDLELEMTLLQAGVPVTGENFLTMMGAWDAGEQECGEFVGLKDGYTMETTNEGALLTVEGDFAERDGALEFAFDKKGNIEEEHLDFFKDLEDIRHSFHQFAELLPEDGTLIINAEIKDYAEIYEGLSCNVVTYGTNGCFDYSAKNITYDENGHVAFDLFRRGEYADHIQLSVTGDHNVSNALSAIAVADILGLSIDITKRGLLSFTGTDRRFEYKGEFNGVTVIDDYAHHPTEILATLKAAQHSLHNSVWCVFQPHTYTRTKAFFHEFAEALSHADHLVLADIFAARETDTLGISSADLAKETEKLGTDTHYFPSFAQIEAFLKENCRPGDLLITMGAGDVVTIGENLLKQTS